MIPFSVPVAALACVLAASAADLTPEQRKLNRDSFEIAWQAVRDNMWEPMPAGVDWQRVHDELLPKVESARTMAEARAAMQSMIDRLHMTHFGFVPAEVYEKLGDVSKPGAGRTGHPGFDVRIIDGSAVVVWIEQDSPAYAAGVRNGWQIANVRTANIRELIDRLSAALPETLREPRITRTVLARFEGDKGDVVPAEFVDGAGARRSVAVELKAPRGMPSNLGYLTTQHVWFESNRLGNTGYIRFNMFMDPGRIATRFADAVQSCKACKGLIIDLRGNPGGIGGMSMGMAGWFISKPDALGVMKRKDGELRFFINPRAETFGGPVAILTDALTASTSEIFAGGLKDLGRARIFGTKTAGAALPSVFIKLPNGDGFQYAIANYVSKGGKALEGAGVAPDQEVRLTRESLLSGRDPVIDAAMKWIEGAKQ